MTRQHWLPIVAIEANFGTHHRVGGRTHLRVSGASGSFEMFIHFETGRRAAQ